MRQSSLKLNFRSFSFFFFAEECLIEADPSKYYYVSQGMLTIDNVDDVEEMKLTDEAFDILGFTPVRLFVFFLILLFLIVFQLI